jgi:hypothetical protein
MAWRATKEGADGITSLRSWIATLPLDAVFVAISDGCRLRNVLHPNVICFLLFTGHATASQSEALAAGWFGSYKGHRYHASQDGVYAQGSSSGPDSYHNHCLLEYLYRLYEQASTYKVTIAS